MADSNGEKLIGPEPLGILIGLPANSIRRLARLGLIPYYRFGRLMRFDAQAVLATVRQDSGNNGEEGQDD